MRILATTLPLFAAFLLPSCGPTTPSKRIDRNTQVFNELSPRDQELVSQGQIEAGMSPGAVFLAMGEPDRQLNGERDGQRTMRWDYLGFYPIYTNQFFGGLGFGNGFYGPNFGGFGVGPTVELIPARSSSVWFENDKVRSWERLTQ